MFSLNHKIQRHLKWKSLTDETPYYLAPGGQGHRDSTLLFEGTVISQKLSDRIFYFFIDLL